MARATVAGNQLRILINQAEATRRKVEEVNEQCEISWYNSVIGDESYLNQRRDWYVALVDRGAENIMLENEDYLEYFFLVSFDFDSWEKHTREHYEEQLRQRQWQKEHEVRAVNCPVLEEELAIREEVHEAWTETPPGLWQRFTDWIAIPKTGPGG